MREKSITNKKFNDNKNSHLLIKMARTRAQAEMIRTTNANSLDNIHTLNDVCDDNPSNDVDLMETNRNNELDATTNQCLGNVVNYEGKVNDLPSLEQIKKIYDKFNKNFKELSIKYRILPIYYLTVSSPFVALLLLMSIPNSNYEKSIMNEMYVTKETLPVNDSSVINEELFSGTYESMNVDSNKETIILINKLNMKIFKLSEQLKSYQTMDQVALLVNKEVEKSLNIYEKGLEKRQNNDKSLNNQKFGIINQKLQNIEIELRRLNDEIFFLNSNSNQALKIDSNGLKSQSVDHSSFLNSELNNIHSEIAGFKEYCLENTKFQEISFQKHQKKLYNDLKYWIENNFVSKSELIKFLDKSDETKFNIWNYMSFSKNDKTASSVDINQIKELIKQALYIYNADKTGMPDFALESAGAFVISSRSSSSYYHKGQPEAWLFGIRLPYYHNSPRLAIQPQVFPGECWSFKGTKGKLTIQLASRIVPTAFSIEHLPIVLDPNGRIDSAINDFSVYGYKDQKSKNSILLGNYQYDANSPEYLQYFPLQIENNVAIQVVEFRIETNHGNKEYTCIYRVRVHGVLE